MDAAEKIISFPHEKPQAKAKGRRADGLIARHFRYRDLYGISHRKSVYGHTKAEAEAKKREFLTNVALCLRMDQQGRTVASWTKDWLMAKESLSASTFAGYSGAVRLINEHLGSRPLNSILPSDLKLLMLTRQGYSASTIRKLAMTIRSIFGEAAENRLIPFDPAIRLKATGGTIGTHRALSAEEQTIVEKVAQTHRFGYVVMLMLWGGLRRGEACAFRADTCLKGKELDINQAVEWVHNKPRLKAPKTRAGVRSVPVWPALEPFLQQTGYAAQSVDRSDKLITLSAFDRGFESFANACDEELNGCTKRWQPKDHVWKTMALRTHDLRHTWFTMLYDADVDVKIAALWGGHGDINVTMRIYQHIRDARKKDAVRRVLQHTAGVVGGTTGGNRKVYRLKRK